MKALFNERAPAAPACSARRSALVRMTRTALGGWMAVQGVLAATPALAQATAPTERKLALVIGNGNYRNGPLKNPVADAKAVADSLRALGFDVLLRTDAGLADMLEAMRQFSVRAADAAVRLVFFAGHGLQSRGRNYLLPVDADIKGEDEVAGRSADVGELIDRLSRVQHGINIVILDACRNNPFSGGEIVTADGRRLKFRGLAPKGLAAIDAPAGTMVAFSTSPGGVALDNAKEEHSLYTKHLIDHMKTPGLPVELLFKQVRVNVARDTQRMQVPWESSSLTGEFCFKADGKGTCSVTRLGQ
jgi:carboxyl-terminal processing protease